MAVRIAQIGIGPLGREMTRAIHSRPNMKVVAAVDADPGLCGQDLGDLCSLGMLGISVASSVKSALKAGEADVALLTTVSDLIRIMPQIEEILEFGVPVLTTCEELTYPWITAPESAARLNSRAREKGVAVLATGVNPGFMMDTLPICLTAVAQWVQAIKVSRIQDAAHRRLPFQKKIGAGLDPDEFEDRRTSGILRHVGLTESMHMISARLGWTLDHTEEEITPVIAERSIVTQTTTIKPGMVAGVQQIGRAFVGGNEKISLLFRAAVGEEHPEDTVEILGEPHIVSTITGGVHGDVATCAVALNAIPVLLKAEPGLRTMIDLPPIAFSVI
jgi:4-hydroxy-tetrahydrodipicolinate reductase